ncbi:hydrogenase formation protein HypD [Coprobacter sp.]
MFEEFRNPEKAKTLLEAIHRITRHPCHIMEICGGQTHALARFRIEPLLPKEIQLIHGPGCPVCVTPVPIIDAAIQLALKKEIIFTSFGDMLRVPGSKNDLLHAKAQGADVRMIYSPLDALRIASENPEREVVFFGIGFETTAPIHALSILQAHRKKIRNFSVLTSLFTVPQAISTIAQDKECSVNGILAAGHVCAVTGISEYEELAKCLKLSISITGFEPLDLLFGIYTCISQLENQEYTVQNAYKRIVAPNGNPKARQEIEDVFEICNREWRGMGNIQNSGYQIRQKYEQYDALKRFNIKTDNKKETTPCQAGEIMKGKIAPIQCKQFGKCCTPEHPLGAPMVSSEGACAAYYRYNF